MVTYDLAIYKNLVNSYGFYTRDLCQTLMVEASELEVRQLSLLGITLYTDTVA